jgi:hypothetical protein
MPDLREYARAALAQTDEQLEADCEWRFITRPAPVPPALHLRHRPTGIEVEAESRATEKQTRLIALLQLRNRCYDMLRSPPNRPVK